MTGNQEQARGKVCVILPTYDNRPTVGEVVRDVLDVTSNVIVVDDGSRDGTADVLRRFPEITVVTHDRNHGKGAAIASGFERAAEMGFAHAITMDADGQHVSSDLSKFLAAVESNPDALVVGVRNLCGLRGLRSRLLRANSNFWVWVHTGRWLPDTQSGFRAYPLVRVRGLWLRTKRYDFEVEALVRFLWSGGEVLHVPVAAHYQTGSPSHFRPIKDFALVTHLNGCLLTQRLFMPAALRMAYSQTYFQRGPKLKLALEAIRKTALREAASVWKLALCVGVGVFLGILPIWGFQSVAAVIAAHRLRLNKPLVLAATHVSFPAAIPLILYVSLLTGRLILTGHVDYSLSLAGLDRATVGNYALEYLVGSMALAMVAGAATTAVFYAVAKTVMTLRRRVLP